MKTNIYDILFWIFFILAVAMALWYIFGNSPTIEQALLVLVITFLFKIQSEIIHNKSGLKMLEIRFNALAKDFKEKVMKNK